MKYYSYLLFELEPFFVIRELEVLVVVKLYILIINNEQAVLFFSFHTGPTKRKDVKEGLLWWDLNKKQVEVPSQHRVRTIFKT